MSQVNQSQKTAFSWAVFFWAVAQLGERLVQCLEGWWSGPRSLYLESVFEQDTEPQPPPNAASLACECVWMFIFPDTGAGRTLQM